MELCADLSLDGLTPSVALLGEARDVCTLPIMVMVRPRPGLIWGEARRAIGSDEVGGSGLFGEKVKLPDRPAGTMMVFRIFDRMSYALVMEAQSEIRVMDIVRNP